MAKSNWKGTSGWGAINDPTGALNGRVLVASAGITATNEDYLTTLVGTSTAFSAQHYSVYMDYAFPNYKQTHPFIGGTLSLIARASNFQGDPQSSYDCYLGQLDVESRKVKIVRRNSNSETTLISADMPNTAISRGTKHTIEFKCYGTAQPTLQLIIDNTMVANIGDISSSKLSSGFAGLQVRNGTVYVDAFTVAQYSSDGATPSLWTPMQITGATLSAWYIGSVELTTSGNSVTAWADQSINSNDLSAMGTEPQKIANAVNNYDVVEFNGSSNFLAATDASSLDMFAEGVTVFSIVSTKTYSAGGIVNKNNTYSLDTNATDGYKFTNFTKSTSTSSFVGLTETYHMVGAVTDKDNDTGVGALWIDGVNTAGITFNVGADNSAELFIGKNATPNFFTGNIAEVVLFKGECSEEQRQLIEGYLSHKYATASLLPSTHPYKNFAPVIQS